MSKNGLHGILKKSVGHGLDERKIECDCLWCRPGGTFDQALASIKVKLLEIVSEEKIAELIYERLRGDPVGFNVSIKEYEDDNNKAKEIAHAIVQFVRG